MKSVVTFGLIACAAVAARLDRRDCQPRGCVDHKRIVDGHELMPSTFDID
jgi:hypothetical protein